MQTISIWSVETLNDYIHTCVYNNTFNCNNKLSEYNDEHIRFVTFKAISALKWSEFDGQEALVHLLLTMQHSISNNFLHLIVELIDLCVMLLHNSSYVMNGKKWSTFEQTFWHYDMRLVYNYNLNEDIRRNNYCSRKSTVYVLHYRTSTITFPSWGHFG